ncbi:Cof-type HAD-IIB family hydrolase [Ihubacter massiliensis]|uniref:Cof-type HAD-IIB family hydrolase n=1 Tax=Hominibacterium faecale TaxID=2839743 RepID=A0A9J6QXX8_9FIRM|nr:MULTISPECIES: HAD family hydrolase [Eubacteriales Family XIII. Incertae Sedis]MCI7302352.1 Cof-type HAD-IIB family hydrolase [Clostridia bacterium]MDE8733906.1 HAD family hydrolase [Eubacteriales bacterium DFI.9.88]MDY3011019.1 HAD family hydrolase [Clostridiales Family XIII bacterium]MCO7123709.1 Cof-type HAD-IIB family hydrolase [Ihubacter massiliensis]MCU7380363.1 Cof-type HAD-IIB family hydrolase [Hominibacterium faecale]
MSIKLIALDLDGTTLNDDRVISEANRKALEEAIDRGVNVVIATGRTYSALPEDVFRIRGIQYVLTSNGAIITDLREKKVIYENCIAPSAVEEAVALLKQYDFMVEAFTEGHAYIDKSFYDHIKQTGLSFRHVDYVLTTREPIAGLFDFILEHKEHIENINVNFEDQRDRARMRQVLLGLENTTLTTSFDHNLEIGGATTSKAAALQELEHVLGVKPEEMMAIGDSPNDAAMLRLAGMPVAVGNAKDEVKAVAKYVTGTNHEDGVAQAVRKFVLE